MDKIDYIINDILDIEKLVEKVNYKDIIFEDDIHQFQKDVFQDLIINSWKSDNINLSPYMFKRISDLRQYIFENYYMQPCCRSHRKIIVQKYEDACENIILIEKVLQGCSEENDLRCFDKYIKLYSENDLCNFANNNFSKDLRLIVLLTSLTPLDIYGFSYEGDISDLDSKKEEDVLSELTNFEEPSIDA